MEAYLGEIRLLPYTFAPSGWLACQGQIQNISENAALFSLIGTMFGGDGTQTYALPDLRAHSPISADGPVGYCICVSGAYPNRP